MQSRSVGPNDIAGTPNRSLIDQLTIRKAWPMRYHF